MVSSVPAGHAPTRPSEVAGAIVSSADRRRPLVRRCTSTANAGLLVVLLILGLGPLLWLAKAAITPTQDTLRLPMALWPHGLAWSNLSTAWTTMDLGRSLVNTVCIAAGAWFCQILVATTGGYALSVLRPRYAGIVTGAVLSTLLVPSVVLLVPLYLTILDPPGLGHSLINSFWAVWLPAGANAFNVLLVKRFFDNLPREIFEAAEVDGAGPYRLFISIVLPMSRPILGVVSVFAIISAWKDYLWPMLVLPDPTKQPLSVRLPVLAGSVELGTLLAGLLISTIAPVLLFLVVQRLFLRGAGLGGALKG
ncbi:MAG: multiple sugar transport system permease protein [Pseudonocardiales bacterium]|jgi:multiple sugar transport system permease protein|nr:multiple sugar transport system permease protein [Pseudonocardiales bacterium]